MWMPPVPMISSNQDGDASGGSRGLQARGFFRQTRSTNLNDLSKQITNFRAPSFARSLRKGWETMEQGDQFSMPLYGISPENPKALVGE